MSTLADRVITALRSNHDDLAVRVRAFGPDDLARESGSAEWDVAGVLSHLGSGAEIMQVTLQAGVAGTDAPGADFAPSVWDRWNAMAPQDRAEGFLRTNEALVATMEGLDTSTRDKVRVQLGFLPEPVGLDVLSGMRLSEVALHTWDVRVAFDPQAAASSSEADLALELISGPLGFLLGFLGRGEAPHATEVTLRVETVSPDRVYGLVLADKARLIDAPAEADGILGGPAEAILRLMYGRLAPKHTPESLTLTGNAVTLDQLRAVFPGI